MTNQATSVEELKRMSAAELKKEIYRCRAECAKMRIGIKTQSEKNHALYRTKRREIARMLTILEIVGRNETKERKKKTKRNLASQKPEVTVKDAAPEEKSKKVASKKRKQSSLSSLSSEALAKEDSPS